ncbi:MAG: zinc-binding dehydrogenase, partial [Pseudomonadota bacterium]
HGAPGTLEVREVDAPSPGEGEVGIAVEAAGIGFVDSLMIADKHQVHHPLPFAPGMEVVGRVTGLGHGTAGFQPGDRVAAVLTDGGLAEIAVAQATETFAVPEGCDPVATAGALVSALTADLALVDRARLEPGERVLVGGAAGGVGLAAVQLARAMDAHVLAVASSPDRQVLARTAGAQEAMDYKGLAARIKAKDLKVDVVIDPVGGAFGAAAPGALDWCGRYVTVGFAGGAPPVFKGNHLLIKNRAAMGMVLGYYRRHRTQALARSAGRVFAAISAGSLDLPLTVLDDLSAAEAVIEDLRMRRFAGKAVIAMTQPRARP